jgi:uncharacterized protein
MGETCPSLNSSPSSPPVARRVAVNAVAGGGTLLTFPVLLMFGTPPVLANATSTVGLVIGTAGSIVSFRGHLKAVREQLWRFIPICLVGAAIGSWLLTQTSDDQFSKLIPFLVLFATVLFFIQGFLRKPHEASRRNTVWFHSRCNFPWPSTERSLAQASAS